MASVATTAIDGTSTATAGDFVQLMKPRVMSLVVFTALVGLVAAPGMMNPLTAATSVLSVALAAGASGALNMWFDADIDRLMARTATRPIPAGKIAPNDAMAFGSIMSLLAITLMALSSTVLAASLLAFSIFFYAVVYTMWLKRSTDQNIVIGGAAGAFPPVIGWAAATGAVPMDAWILFGIIFLWTPPHFWALSLWTSAEYGRAGVPMLPVTKGPAETRRQILVYALIVSAFALLPFATGLGGPLYLASALIGGAAMIGYSVRVFVTKAGDEQTPESLRPAKALFGVSILYLFALFAALLIEHGVLPIFGLGG